VLAAGDSAGSLLLACGRAWLAESQGDYADAAALAAQAGLSAGTVPQAWCWQPGWLVAVAHVGGRGGAPDLLSQAAALADAAAARNPQIPTITGVAAQIGGLLTGDVAALARAVEILAASPRPLVRAAAFEDFGRGLLAANQRDRAVPALDSAWDSYAAVGAVGEAQRVRRLLQGAGVRRRRWTRAPARPVRGWAALTATEQRVARLIADGHTNRSAAAELVLSPNTVASHLRSIFGKLGVSSRVQLTRSMLDQGRSPRLTGSLEDFGCPVAQSPPG
jgi:DNA-binding CsgD family transcriptional regulator